ISRTTTRTTSRPDSGTIGWSRKTRRHVESVCVTAGAGAGAFAGPTLAVIVVVSSASAPPQRLDAADEDNPDQDRALDRGGQARAHAEDPQVRPDELQDGD